MRISICIIYQDCLPHVVSVIDTLFPGAAPRLRDLGFERGGALLRLSLDVGGIDASVRLERRAAARCRRVRVAGERQWTLEFTQEPGTARVDDRPLPGIEGWQSRPRPMTRMLQTFVDCALTSGTADERLGTGTALRAAELMAACEPLYNQCRDSWLAYALETRDAADEDLRYALTEILNRGASIDDQTADTWLRQVIRRHREDGSTEWLAAFMRAAQPAAVIRNIPEPERQGDPT